MGRWFGYRRGYEDLPRVWMTERLEEFFRIGATIDAEIREELADLSRPPYDPERLRGHTSTPSPHRHHVRCATAICVHASLSYEGKRIQTIVFSPRPGHAEIEPEAQHELLVAIASKVPTSRTSPVGSNHVFRASPPLRSSSSSTHTSRTNDSIRSSTASSSGATSRLRTPTRDC